MFQSYRNKIQGNSSIISFAGAGISDLPFFTFNLLFFYFKINLFFNISFVLQSYKQVS